MKLVAVFIFSLACHAMPNGTIDKMPVQAGMIVTTSSEKMNITIGSKTFEATVYDNATAQAFIKRLPLTLDMVELNGNEKYGELSLELPTNASNPGTIEAGDLMLYGSSTLVIFYKTFSTSYRYTKIGHIDNPEGLAAALGRGNVRIYFKRG